MAPKNLEVPAGAEEYLSMEQKELKNGLKDLAASLQAAQNKSGGEHNKFDRLLNELSRAILSISPTQPYSGRTLEALRADAESLLK